MYPSPKILCSEYLYRQMFSMCKSPRIGVSLWKIICYTVGILSVGGGSGLDCFSGTILHRLVPPFLLHGLLGERLTGVRGHGSERRVVSHTTCCYGRSSFGDVTLSGCTITVESFGFPGQLRACCCSAGRCMH